MMPPFVTPAKAGAHHLYVDLGGSRTSWVPAFAGMTEYMN
jgi:hypothetical protein